jgi:hypothetical protein
MNLAFISSRLCSFSTCHGFRGSAGPVEFGFPSGNLLLVLCRGRIRHTEMGASNKNLRQITKYDAFSYNKPFSFFDCVSS